MKTNMWVRQKSVQRSKIWTEKKRWSNKTKTKAVEKIAWKKQATNAREPDATHCTIRAWATESPQGSRENSPAAAHKKHADTLP